MPSSLDLAIQRLGNVLADIADVVERPDGPADLLGRLGWDLPPEVDDIGLAALDFSDLLTAIANLEDLIDAGTTGLDLDTGFAQVAVALGEFLQGIDTVVNAFASTGDYLTQTDIVDQFIPRLLDYCVVSTLQSTSLLTIGLLMFLGIVELQPYPADPTIYQVQHVRQVVNWDRIPQLFSDIKGLLSEVFQWGVANADPSVLVSALGTIISGLGVSVSPRALPAGPSRRWSVRTYRRPTPTRCCRFSSASSRRSMTPASTWASP